jgi:hypothetical protein
VSPKDRHHRVEDSTEPKCRLRTIASTERDPEYQAHAQANTESYGKAVEGHANSDTRAGTNGKTHADHVRPWLLRLVAFMIVNHG